MPPDPLTADTAFLTATLALSKSQRLLASWAPSSLPPFNSHPHPYKTTPQQQEQKEDEEEDENFTPLSELAGLGAAKGKEEEGGKRRNGDRDRDIDALERLRRELLGKGKGKGKGARNRKSGVEMSSRAVSVHARIPVNKPLGKREEEEEEEEEEEGGRSSLGKVVRMGRVMRGGSHEDGEKEGEGEGADDRARRRHDEVGEAEGGDGK